MLSEPSINDVRKVAPYPLVHIWDRFTALDSCNLPVYIFFSINPPPTLLVALIYECALTTLARLLDLGWQ